MGFSELGYLRVMGVYEVSNLVSFIGGQVMEGSYPRVIVEDIGDGINIDMTYNYFLKGVFGRYSKDFIFRVIAYESKLHIISFSIS